MFRDSKLEKIMIRPVICVNEEDSFDLVEKKLRGKIRHLPVVDSKGRVVGLFSQRDLFRIVSPHRTEEGGYVYDPAMLYDFILKRQMTPEPFTLTPEDPVSRALDAMIRNRYGCIPITDEKKVLLGIVTTEDILKWALAQLQPAET